MMIVYLEDPSSYEYITDEVRAHLTRCVRTRELLKFPFVRHCICEGQAGGRMVACDACDRWFHRRCITDSNIGKNAEWFCSVCK